MSKCIYVYLNLYCIVLYCIVLYCDACCAGPPGKQHLAEGGYPVEISEYKIIIIEFHSNIL